MSEQTSKSKFLSLIRDKRDELDRLCAAHGVCQLSLFGSATSGHFDPEKSDLDFLVVFKASSPAERAEHFFGLQEGLCALFGHPIDLVESHPIRNPYFRAEVEKSRIPLYDAA